MIISITGSPGSGKSTVGEKLAEKLNYQRYNAGAIRRQVAKEKEMTLAEFNEWSKNNIAGERVVDDFLEKTASDGSDNIVVEGRLAWHFIPQSLKIYLYATSEEGAKRIWSSYEQDKEKRNEDNIKSLEDLIISVKNREKNDDTRYKKHYNINMFRKENYDLYLDVTNMNPQQEFEAVYQFIKKHLEKE